MLCARELLITREYFRLFGACNTFYIDLDSCYTHDLSLIPNIMEVIFANRNMGAVGIVKYIEEN